MSRRPSDHMETAVERYFVDKVATGSAGITVLHQELRSVQVHWHDFYELVYVRSGTARHLLNGTVSALGPGSIVMLTPADFHEFAATSAEPLCCYNVVVDAAVVERELDELLPPGVGWAPAVLETAAGTEADFARLWAESQEARLGAGALRTALLRCILIEVARLRDGIEPLDEESVVAVADDVRRAIRYVERHFREPLSLADVATEARLSPNYLSERFRQVTGSSLQSYLQNLRLRFARSLLASTTLGVTEICHAAGFNSPSHFGRAYRRRYGETPSAARPSARRDLT